MTVPIIEDLANISVEHMVGMRTGLPLVKVRAEGDHLREHIVLTGQLSPAQARQIAADLMNAAARAEYEVDFISEANRLGWDAATTGAVLLMVRKGEEARCSIGDNDRLEGPAS